MRIAGYLLLVIVVAPPGWAQSAATKMTPDLYRQMADDYQYWDAQERRYEVVRRRARALYPARRDLPLRELNISDDEVRDVQSIALQYLPRAYVNISPVVTDCPCEEGPTCTAQVYVVAQAKGKTHGLQLSRINKTWSVGIVQQWWLRRQAIVRQHTGNAYLDDYLYDRAVNELYEEFPQCVGFRVPSKPTIASQPTAERK